MCVCVCLWIFNYQQNDLIVIRVILPLVRRLSKLGDKYHEYIYNMLGQLYDCFIKLNTVSLFCTNDGLK